MQQSDLLPICNKYHYILLYFSFLYYCIHNTYLMYYFQIFRGFPYVTHSIVYFYTGSVVTSERSLRSHYMLKCISLANMLMISIITFPIGSYLFPPTFSGHCLLYPDRHVDFWNTLISLIKHIITFSTDCKYFYCILYMYVIFLN